MNARIGPLSVSAWKHGFWFRVFGYGFHIMLRDFHRPLFSERMGLRSAAYVGPLRIEYLRPQ